MISKKTFFILVWLFFNATIKSRTELQVTGQLGPGWFYSSIFLLPTAATEDSGLLTTANDASAWNLYSWMVAEGTLKFKKRWRISAELAGGLMRNGRAIVTDSQQTKIGELAVGNSVNDYVVIKFNALDFNCMVGYDFLPTDQLKISPYF